MNTLLTLAHSIYSNKGIYAVLLGSGISRTSGIPTGWEIMLNIIERIAVLEKADMKGDPAAWYQNHYKEVPDYSNIIEKLTFTPEERINLLKKFIEPSSESEDKSKKPAPAHHQLAQLVSKGYIKVIVTTNFDRLMESALNAIGVEPTIISSPAHVENAVPIIHSPVTLIKLNGDYLDTSFLNLKSELTSYDPRMTGLLQTVFENFGLVSCGWSGKWDIGLVNSLKSGSKFRYGTYFTHMGKIEAELEELSRFRKATLVPIKNADDLFTELAENIEALERTGMHPLSRELSIARVKKYVSEENERIRLHDFIMDEVKRTVDKINAGLDYSSPTELNVKTNLDFFQSETKLIAELVMTGVYWGKEYHEETWLQSILRMAHPQKAERIYTLWSTLKYLPSVLLIYGAGLAAVIRKDFKFLKRMFSLQVITESGQEEVITYNSNPGSLMETSSLNQVLGGTQYAPMNEIIFKYFASPITNFLASEKLYDDIFDYFEIVNAVFYLKIKGRSGFPWGKFKYRTYPTQMLRKLHKQIQEQKENHELVRRTLFDNYDELIGHYNYLIEYIG